MHRLISHDDATYHTSCMLSLIFLNTYPLQSINRMFYIQHLASSAADIYWKSNLYYNVSDSQFIGLMIFFFFCRVPIVCICAGRAILEITKILARNPIELYIRTFQLITAKISCRRTQ